jgi:hypothetical protein
MATIVEAKWAADGKTPEFEAADFKELEARARGPDVLTDAEMGFVAEHKEKGNTHFRAGSVEEALGEYNRALEIFADRDGGPKQRGDKSKLLANRAECLLRLRKWDAAERSAAKALAIDEENAKARFRRARANAELGSERNLAEALADLAVLRVAGDGTFGKAEAQLQAKVLRLTDELKAVRRKDAGGLRKAFAAGKSLFAGLTGAATDDDDAAAAAYEIASGGKIPMTESAGKGLFGDSAAWLSRLGDECDARTRCAWLIDVYRTRVDDDGHADDSDAVSHGLLAPTCSAVGARPRACAGTRRESLRANRRGVRAWAWAPASRRASLALLRC